MRPIRITYDPEGDILYITFGHPTEGLDHRAGHFRPLRIIDAVPLSRESPF
jgi:uncharacterized protein YuzE